MTGRWVASLPDPDDHLWGHSDPDSLRAAAQWLSLALERPDTRCAQIAAALIRRHRKSLDATSERYADYGNGLSDEALLWRALYRVSNAAKLEVTGREPGWSADDLREAEAALRTLWKRRQGRAS